jgi:hypothetical protein
MGCEVMGAILHKKGQTKKDSSLASRQMKLWLSIAAQNDGLVVFSATC